MRMVSVMLCFTVTCLYLHLSVYITHPTSTSERCHSHSCLGWLTSDFSRRTLSYTLLSGTVKLQIIFKTWCWTISLSGNHESSLASFYQWCLHYSLQNVAFCLSSMFYIWNPMNLQVNSSTITSYWQCHTSCCNSSKVVNITRNQLKVRKPCWPLAASGLVLQLIHKVVNITRMQHY